MINVRNEAEVKARALAEVAQNTVTDMSAVADNPKTNKRLLASYICLVGLTCGELLGHFLFTYPLRALMDDYMVLNVSFLLLPIRWFFYNICIRC